MTCRGSRFADGAKRNPDGQVFMKNRETDEWLKQNQKATREFIRKWGHFVNHDQYLKPIIPPKYDIGIIVKNCNLELLKGLEPWCSTVYVDDNRTEYITVEQPFTSFDLTERVKPYDNEKQNDVLVEIDGQEFDNRDFEYIQQLPEIIANDEFLGAQIFLARSKKELGELFELGSMKITINSLETKEKELIVCKKY